MPDAPALHALLVDPSLFTAPYDAALTDGLVAAGVQPLWAVRPVRRRDRQEIPALYVDDFFYRHVDDNPRIPRSLRKLVKGVAHAAGLVKLLDLVARRRPAVVHFQWAVLPTLDILAMALIRRRCPVVMTVHDTVPFNGQRLSLLQNLAFDVPIRFSDRVIVHTEAGRRRLLERGVPPAKVAVIPHGPLSLPALTAAAPREEHDDRYTFVMFGEIKPYKGPDVLIEAVGRLPLSLRNRARFIIAGRPSMDLGPLLARLRELRLEDTVEFRPARLSEEEMAALFCQTDCFLFPYRQVDASGVYFLTKSLGKWIIATRVGVFAEDVQDRQGTLVAPEDPGQLADAILHAVAQRPRPTTTAPDRAWQDIGAATKQVYREAQRGWSSRGPLPERQRPAPVG